MLAGHQKFEDALKAKIARAEAAHAATGDVAALRCADDLSLALAEFRSLRAAAGRGDDTTNDTNDAVDAAAQEDR